jgi:hypothetical protein
MDPEEQRIRQRIEERQRAMTEKINLIKERVERIRQMSDLKSIVAERPALTLAGSIMTGFLVRKIVSGKNSRRARKGTHGSRNRYAPPPEREKGFFGRFGNQVLAVLTGAATRTAINYLSDVGKDMLPKKSDIRRAERDFRGHV